MKFLDLSSVGLLATLLLVLLGPEASGQERTEALPNGCKIVSKKYWDNSLKQWAFGTKKFCPRPAGRWDSSMWDEVPLDDDPNSRANLKPESWVGFQPQTNLGGLNFFSRGKVREYEVLSFLSRGMPPGAQYAFGNIRRDSTYRPGPATYFKPPYGRFVIPMCKRPCDPNWEPDTFMVVYGWNDGKIDDFDYSIFIVGERQTGLRMCTKDIGRYGRAFCYNEAHTTLGGNNDPFLTKTDRFIQNISAYEKRYERLKAIFDKANPNADGLNFLRNAKCRLVTDTYGTQYSDAVEFVDRYECEYKP